MDLVISAISHRTGSTLLQRIFNRRERTIIWGEHGGVLTHMAVGFAEAERFRRNEKDLVGFKEVRYGRAELELVCGAYPAVQTILLVRNPVDVWRSMPEWGRSLGGLIEDFDRRAMEYVGLAERSGFHLLRYEDVVSKTPETLALLSDLGRLTPAQINEVVDGKRLRSTRHEVPAEDVERIHEECAKAMERLGYSAHRP